VTPFYQLDDLPTGGLAIHYRTLAHGLVSRGHDVSILFADRFGSKPQEPDHPGISFIPIQFKLPKIFHTPIIGRILRSLGLTEQIRFRNDSKLISQTLAGLESEVSFDIIESPNNGASLHQYLNRINDQKCIIRIATTDKEHSLINLTTPSPYLYQLFREEGRSFRNCPNLVTHTHAHRDLICREYDLPVEKFSIIPVSVRIPTDKEIIPTVQKEKTVVLFVGRFEKRKGIDVLFDIIASTLSQIKKIEFRLVGQDSNNEHQKAFEKKHPELIPNIRFLGKIQTKALESEYKNCDIFIAPSRYESFGLIYAEAMSFAKPAIGTRIGGIPEVIKDRTTGILCENENVDSYVQAIVELTENPDLAMRIGQSARKRVIERFDQESLIRDTESYYREIQERFRRN